MSKRLTKKIPLVSQDVAMNEKKISPEIIQDNITFPGSVRLATACEARISYDRFVAVTLTRKQVSLMHPIFSTSCIVILDRHATILDQSDIKQKLTIYAIRLKDEMLVGYLSKIGRTLVLRYATSSCSVKLLPVKLDYAASSLIIGRVCGFMQIF